MNQRLRAAVILQRGSSLLLVQHVDPDTGNVWWVPPGGGLEDHDETLLHCAAREAHEETGLDVQVGRLIYLREFNSGGTRNLELFFLGEVIGGTLTTANVRGSGPDEHMIRDVRWVDRSELPTLTVYPEALVQAFWEDLERGFADVLHLGAASG